jgi:DNA-binding CsgD family transcriptional regulator
MVSAQTYINKGRALQQLEKTDSLPYYINRAMELCEGLPYNSGMVDVDLLLGIYLTRKGGDQEHLGIEKLLHVTRQGTAASRAKAYHQLAQTYLQEGQSEMAELMLDNMYSLLTQGDFPVYIHIDYEPILSHYMKTNNRSKAEQYTMMMIQEHQALTEKRLNYNLVEAIVTHQTQQKRQELEILKLKQANQRLWFIILSVLSLVIISAAVAFILYQKKRHKIRMRQADAKLSSLMQKLNQSYAEKAIIAQEVGEIMNSRESRQELESLTPSVLQKSGETKFRQRFELMYPLFLPRLREKVPSITRREELLSMLIVLKQDNKEIAELLAIAPRSVLMLRHRFRAKIGMTTENSLEDFISELLESPDDKM